METFHKARVRKMALRISSDIRKFCRISEKGESPLEPMYYNLDLQQVEFFFVVELTV